MNVLKAILDAIFPPNYTCDLCGGEIFSGKNLCKKCYATITFNDGATCPVCGRRTDRDELCLECKSQTPVYDKAVSALVYEKGGTQLIYKYKNGCSYLKDYFINVLSDKLAELPPADAVCFVPMTRKDEIKRGYNQSYLLAKEISKTLKLPLLKNAMVKQKGTAAQKSLTRREREENLKSAFKAERREVEGKTLIIADDVLTTGATADAISAELKKKGAKRVYFVTVASVEYKSGAKDE